LPRKGEVIAGKYRVDSVVGKGGMGVVLSARHVHLGQDVAIKILSVEGLDDERRHEACTRFLREGQAAARLTSDHVVRIYDVGTLESDAPFMVMELLRGDDLATLLGRQGRAPLDVSMDYVLQACDAVGEAHENGIVHRDLKPSNLFICRRSDGRSLVKVLDFGISKSLRGADSLEGNLTATRTVVGSPFYMSPEQVRDAKRVDTRADIWALGMIFYELLVGSPAFHADTLPGICAAIAADTPPPIRDRRAEVTPELEAIVMKCLEKDPAKRFQTVSDLVLAISPLAPKSAPSSIEYASRPVDLLVSLPGAVVPKDIPTLQLAEDVKVPTLQSPFATDVDIASGSIDPESTEVSSPFPFEPRKKPAKVDGSSTLVSHTGKSEHAPASLRFVSRGALFVAGGLGALVIVGVAVARYTTSIRVASPAAPTATTVAGFTFAIESTPSGASVFEGDALLGRTPLSFTVDNTAVVAAPRRFVLRADGFEPYTIVQGPSDTAVRFRATLTPAPPVAPALAPSSIPLSTLPVAPSSKPAPARPTSSRKPAHAATVPASPDIRLER
jgi:serine/threonine-protein kinase